MSDIDQFLKPDIVRFLKLQLVDDDLVTETRVIGVMKSLSMSIDAESDIRRTATLSLARLDGTDFSGLQTLWMDKLVRVYYGIHEAGTMRALSEEELDAQTDWYLLGTFLSSKNEYSISTGELSISLNLVDLMGAATSERGSMIGSDVDIEAGSDIKGALETSVSQFTRFSQMDVVSFDDSVPYDLEYDRGLYPLDIMTDLVKLFPYYQHYFDKQGVYHVSLIPMTFEDDVVLTAEETRRLIISEDGGYGYDALANCAEVWGKEIESDIMATECVSNGSIYAIQIEDFEVLEEGLLFSFTADADCAAGQKVQIGTTPPMPIYNENGKGERVLITAGEMRKDISYQLKYTNARYVLMGPLLVHGIAMVFNEEPDEETKQKYKDEYNCNDISFIVNPNSLYGCDKQGIGVIKKVYTGGEYDNIYTTQLALERARYELWKNSRQVDKKKLEMIYIPWLDVNSKIEYTSILTGETNQYLVNSIDVSFDGTMNLEVSRFYPLYEWLTGQTWGSITNKTWGDAQGQTWGELFSAKHG